jgi:hypothetical protein
MNKNTSWEKRTVRREASSVSMAEEGKRMVELERERKKGK